MFTPHDVFRLIDELRDMAMEMAEKPDDGQQTAFGYGRTAGFLQAASYLRQRVAETLEQAAKKAEETEI